MSVQRTDSRDVLSFPAALDPGLPAEVRQGFVCSEHALVRVASRGGLDRERLRRAGTVEILYGVWPRRSNRVEHADAARCGMVNPAMLFQVGVDAWIRFWTAAIRVVVERVVEAVLVLVARLNSVNLVCETADLLERLSDRLGVSVGISALSRARSGCVSASSGGGRDGEWGPILRRRRRRVRWTLQRSMNRRRSEHGGISEHCYGRCYDQTARPECL